MKEENEPNENGTGVRKPKAGVEVLLVHEVAEHEQNHKKIYLFVCMCLYMIVSELHVCEQSIYKVWAK